MARRKNKGRSVNGVLLLDKPKGKSSNQTLQIVKKLFKASKAGHTGSLDPLATGMLPICFGEATKLSAFLLDASKSYRFKCKLGVKTNTGDADGTVIQTTQLSKISKKNVKQSLSKFTGSIEQIPPMFSALKHNGERLYKLARQGIEVERKPRPVEIHEIRLIKFDVDILEIEVFCSKGTYIRTLAEDIGDELGCGAHVTQLRRLSVGPYSDDMIFTLEQLEALAQKSLEELDTCLLPVDSSVLDWPDIRLEEDAAYYMRHGQPILVPHAPTCGWVRIYDQNSFMGVGEIQDDGRVAPRRLIAQ